jgi:hypothetical protein
MRVSPTPSQQVSWLMLSGCGVNSQTSLTASVSRTMIYVAYSIRDINHLLIERS